MKSSILILFGLLATLSAANSNFFLSDSVDSIKDKLSTVFSFGSENTNEAALPTATDGTAAE